MIGSRGPQPRRSRRSPRTPERPARQDARAGEASPSTSGEFQDRGGCRTQRRRREPKRDSARLPGSGLPEPCRNGCRENLIRRGAARPYRSRRPGSRGSARSRGRRSRNSRPRRPRARPAPIGSHQAGVLPDRIDGLALRPAAAEDRILLSAAVAGEIEEGPVAHRWGCGVRDDAGLHLVEHRVLDAGPGREAPFGPGVFRLQVTNYFRILAVPNPGPGVRPATAELLVGGRAARRARWSRWRVAAVSHAAGRLAGVCRGFLVLTVAGRVQLAATC